MSNNDSIGIFDSGIGGITVLNEILKILPNENYIYYSDSKNNPYGDKLDKTIFNICDNIVTKFINQKCKAIVIACNTASAKVAKLLREKYPQQIIIAIEPAYKMVYDFAYQKPTLIMATEGTIKSEKFHKLFEKYDNHNTSFLPCKGLADIIEEGNEKKIQIYLKENLLKYRNKVENVVLGCTHYPLIEKNITEVLGNVEFFNGAFGLAKHLKNTLQSHYLLNETAYIGNINFIDSSNSIYKKNRFFKYLYNF